jgi:hypothetical protein
VARKSVGIERRAIGSRAGARDEDLARRIEIRVDPCEHGRHVRLATVMDCELPWFTARSLDRVGRVVIAEIRVARARWNDNHRIAGERVIRVGEIQDAVQPFRVSTRRNRMRIGRLSGRIAIFAGPARTAAVEVEQQTIGRSATNPEPEVLCDGPRGGASRFEQVPAFLQARQCCKDG